MRIGDASPHKFRPISFASTRRSRERPILHRSRIPLYLIFFLLIFVGLLALLSPHYYASTKDSLSTSPAAPEAKASSDHGEKEQLLKHEETILSEENSIKIAIASHGRLMWYYPSSGTSKLLHEGEGVHYGTFPGEKNLDGSLKSLWVIVRPHNWHPTSADEVLLELDAETGAELKRKKIPSRFTHDVVRSGDSVWVCNTEEGKVLKLRYGSMELVRTLDLFTKKEHVNTLAPLRPGKIFALLHNLGMSELALIDGLDDDTRPARVTARIKNVGKSSHGLVEYKGGWLVLDSDRSSLVWIEDTLGLLKSSSKISRFRSPSDKTHRRQSRRMIHDIAQAAEELDSESQHLSSSLPPSALPSTSSVEAVRHDTSVEAVRHVLWTAPEGGKFLKGLSVIDDVAYFGVSKFSPRNSRQNPSADSEIASFDLLRFQIISRVIVPTHGLLNVISAPQLSEKSTYQAWKTFAPIVEATDEVWKALLSSLKSVAGNGDEIFTVKADETKVDRTHESSSPLTREKESADRDQKIVSSLDQEVQRSSLEVQRSSLINDTAVFEASRNLKEMGYEPMIGGKWPTGLPYLDLETKSSGESWKAGIQLPLMMINVSHLRSLVVNCPPKMWEPETQRLDNAVIDGRKGNTDKYKPGVKAMYLMFSDRSTANVYRFAYYDYFQAAIKPLLEQIIGASEMRKIVRMQLALMPPSTTIKAHRDMGGYALQGHRIHIPVTTNPDVSFQVCPRLDESSKSHPGKEVRDEMVVEGDCLPIPMQPGMVFEVNNRVLHRVENKGKEGRVTLVVDVAEQERNAKGLLPGTVCNYIASNMVCENDKIID